MDSVINEIETLAAAEVAAAAKRAEKMAAQDAAWDTDDDDLIAAAEAAFEAADDEWTAAGNALAAAKATTVSAETIAELDARPKYSRTMAEVQETMREYTDEVVRFQQTEIGRSLRYGLAD